MSFRFNDLINPLLFLLVVYMSVMAIYPLITEVAPTHNRVAGITFGDKYTATDVSMESVTLGQVTNVRYETNPKTGMVSTTLNIYDVTYSIMDMVKMPSGALVFGILSDNGTNIICFDGLSICFDKSELHRVQ